MVNPGSRRGSNSSCRKTVSFDIITDHGQDGGLDESRLNNNNNNSSYNGSYSNHYHYRRRPSTNEVTTDDEDDDDDDLFDSPRWKPSRGTKKSPSEPIFKFCKIKSTSSRSVNASDNPNSNRNNNNNNNNNEDNGDDTRQDSDIDSGAVHRRSSMAQVEAIRDYVSRNYASPVRTNNNNNDDGGYEDGNDHSKLIGNIRLFKDGNDFGDRRTLFSSNSINSSIAKGKLLASVESCFMTDMH